MEHTATHFGAGETVPCSPQSSETVPCPGPNTAPECLARREVSTCSALAPDRYGDAVLLAEGGMGAVYQCTDGWTGDVVAMKLVRADRRSVADLDIRLLREAMLQSQLKHRGIPSVRDFGVTTSGQPFFTMDVIAGATMHEHIQARASYVALLGAFVEICDAVQTAHDQGVIHRDIKPANILLTPDGAGHLVDWGIAAKRGDVEVTRGASTTPGAVDDTGRSLTVDGFAVGTPRYMAPERMRGEFGVATDVYCLGAVLLEIVEGADWSSAATGLDLSALRSALSEISARATHDNPQRRFDSATQLAGAVLDATLSWC